LGGGETYHNGEKGSWEQPKKGALEVENKTKITPITVPGEAKMSSNKLQF